MDDVGEQVVVPQPVVHVHLLVVDRQRSVEDTSLLKRAKSPMVCLSGIIRTTHIFLDRVSPELAAEHLEDLLADPAALGERGEGEVVGVHLAQAWRKEERNDSALRWTIRHAFEVSRAYLITFRQRHPHISSDSRFRAQSCVSDE